MTLIIIHQSIWELLIESLQMRNKRIHIIMIYQAIKISRIQGILIPHIIWSIIAEQAIREACLHF